MKSGGVLPQLLSVLCRPWPCHDLSIGTGNKINIIVINIIVSKIIFIVINIIAIVIKIIAIVIAKMSSAGFWLIEFFFDFLLESSAPAPSQMISGVGLWFQWMCRSRRAWLLSPMIAYRYILEIQHTYDTPESDLYSMEWNSMRFFPLVFPMTGFTEFCHNYIEGYILDILMYFIGISLCALLLKLDTVWPLKYKDLAEDDSFWKGQSYDQ